MKLDQINSIISEKWEELEKEDSIFQAAELVKRVEAFKDFKQEYHFHYVQLSEMGELENEEDFEREFAFVEEAILSKWAFVFASIVNLDVQNEEMINIVFQALRRIVDEDNLQEI